MDTTPQAGSSSLKKPLIALLALAAIGAATFTIHLQLRPTKPASAAATGPKPAAWVAAAPGRVEPLSGEFRVGSAMLGRVVELPVGVNGFVEQDEVIVRLDDDEARARLTAAEAEASVRHRERDGQPATAGRDVINKAEDAFYTASRAVTNARFEVDFALAARRTGTAGADAMLTSAVKRLTDARERLQKERAAFALAQVKPGLPAPNRLEAGLTLARTEVDIAESMLQKTRIRSPITGTLLTLNAKAGEIIAPSAELPIAVIGNTYLLRVRAEVDEADATKIRRGQAAYVRNAGFPGKEFEGKVATIAPTLSAPKLANRGARRPTDVEVLDVVIDLDGNVPLLPGMRVDAYFRKD